MSDIQSLARRAQDFGVKVDWWNDKIIWVLVAAALVALATVLATYMAFRRAKQFAGAQAELDAAKEKMLSDELHARKVELDKLGIELADAKKRQADAELKLEKLKNPRSLSAEAISILRRGAHGKAVIQCLVDVTETKMFASNLYGALLSAGWDMSPAPGVVPVNTFNVDVGFSDIFVLGRTIEGADSDDPSTPVGAFFKALKKDGYKPGAMLNASVSDDMLIILVSHRP